jgi:hypothetical protein
MIEKPSPIFAKTYDFLLWLLNTTEKFPKSERFRLAKRIDDSIFLFHDILVDATRTRTPRCALLETDRELDRLRLYVRLSDERSLLKDNQYRYASEQLTEIGKLLGGWLKTLSNEKNRNRTYADRS